MLKELEDLIWCVESPSLISEELHYQGDSYYSVQTQAIDPSFRSLAIEQHRDLMEHLSTNKSHFLGPYFEQLWKYHLQQDPNLELVASNLQISEAGRTIGEFDFIVYDKTKNLHIHQELAIKFYLGYPQNGTTSWIGPQTVDRLDIKMDRLLSHQLQLSKHQVAMDKLKELGIERLEKQIVMKGYLFEPRHLDKVSFPDYVNPNHLIGSWTTQSRFKEQIKQTCESDSFWKPLQKLEWLRPYKTSGTMGIFTSKTITGALDFSRPILLSKLRKKGNDYKEVEKLFVVSDSWPEIFNT